MGEFVEGDGAAVGFVFSKVRGLAGSGGTEMAKGHEAAEVAVAFAIGSKKHYGYASCCGVASGEWRVARKIKKRQVQSYAEDGFYARGLGRLIKGNGGVQAVGVRERDSGHLVFGGCGDDFARRRNAPQEGVVAVTVEMDEHFQRPVPLRIRHSGQVSDQGSKIRRKRSPLPDAQMVCMIAYMITHWRLP